MELRHHYSANVIQKKWKSLSIRRQTMYDMYDYLIERKQIALRTEDLIDELLDPEIFFLEYIFNRMAKKIKLPSLEEYETMNMICD